MARALGSFSSSSRSSAGSDCLVCIPNGPRAPLPCCSSFPPFTNPQRWEYVPVERHSSAFCSTSQRSRAGLHGYVPCLRGTGGVGVSGHGAPSCCGILTSPGRTSVGVLGVLFRFPGPSQVVGSFVFGLFLARPLSSDLCLSFQSKPTRSGRLGFGFLLLVLLVCFVQVEAGETEVSPGNWSHR